MYHALTLNPDAQAIREAGLAQFAQLPERHQAMAHARWDVLRALDSYLQTTGLDGRHGRESFVAAYEAGEVSVSATTKRLLPQITTSTLYRWCSRARKGGLPALAPRYKGQPSRIESLPALSEWISGLMHERPDVRPNLAWEILQATQPELAGQTSERSLRRYIRQWREENNQLHKYLSNPDGWKSHMKWSPGSASEGIERLNQVWELDSTPADVLLVDGRHSIVGVIDVYSRRVQLVVSRTSKATAVGAVLRKALLAWGVPEIARTDNGKDYTSQYVTSVLNALEIEHELCPPFKSEAKPFIERFFGTFGRSVLELLPGYAGHDVAERKRIEARVPFAERLFGEREPIEIRLTAADLQRFCDRWLEKYYETRSHTGLGGRSPRQVAAEWAAQHPIQRVANERALDVLLSPAPAGGYRTVNKKGVEIERGTYTSPDLALHVGERVRVLWADGDYGRVWLFTSDGQFICEAENPARTGASLQAIAAAGQTLQKEALRAGRAAGRLAQQTYLAGVDVVDAALRAAAEQDNSELPPALPAAEYQTAALTEAALAAAGPAPTPPHDPKVLERGSAAVARIEERRAARGSDDDTALNDQLWERYQSLRGRDDLSDKDRSWAKWFETSPIYRSRLRLLKLAQSGAS